MKQNGVIMQYFHWYIRPEMHLWNQLKNDASHLSNIGITAIWMPPAYKGAGGNNDTGYGVYDMYDLGEFDQKGSIETKYGYKDEYLSCIEALHDKHIDVYADIVLNHRMGADEYEEILAKEVNRLNTKETISDEKIVKVATKFTFPNRHQKYSDFTWNWTHFDGIDYDEKTHRNTILLFENKQWENQVDDENGNYDYLMGADLDFNNSETVHEVYDWAKWYLDLTQIDGLRLDAVKHISASFYKEFLETMRQYTNKELFSVGEYWHGDFDHLSHYLQEINFEMSIFDVPLHYHFYDASQNEDYDMRTIFDRTVVQSYPYHAVTFVDNHDTQPSQPLGSFIADWFKPLAYALILLRVDGYPCIFYGDYYGIEYEHIDSQQDMLDKLLYLRQHYNYGELNDYFDHPHIIGWVRRGDDVHTPLVVVMSHHQDGIKQMHVGKQYAGFTFYDYLGHYNNFVKIDENGNGQFFTYDKNISIYILKT